MQQHTTHTITLRYMEFAIRQNAFLGTNENQLLLSICRRLNQCPPLALFPQHGAWATRHRSRWWDHPIAFHKIASSQEPVWAAELPSMEPLYSIALKCLEWHPDARYRAYGLVAALQAVEGWQFPRVQPTATTSSASTSTRPGGAGSTLCYSSRSFARLSLNRSDIVMDLDPEESEGRPRPSHIALAGKRRRVSGKTPPGPSTSSVNASVGCKCSSQNCRSGTHNRGKSCGRPQVAGSDYCSDCKCQTCPRLRRGTSGLCRACSATDLPWGLQLVRTFGEQALLPLMIPVDVEALYALHEDLLAVGRSDPVLLVIAAWAKDPAFVRHLSQDAPGPDCSAAELQRHIHRALRSIAGSHAAEAGACIRGGRHTGLVFCLRWLGLATKKNSKSCRQDFPGGVPFQAFKPPRLVENVGSCGTLELGRSLEGLQALIAGFRASDYPSVTMQHNWSELRDQFRAAVTKATEKYSMGLTGAYVAPHILRKLLLLNGDLPHLTAAEMEELVPDEQHVLDKLPASLRERGRLARALHCADIYITCYNCLGPSCINPCQQHHTSSGEIQQ